MARRRKGLESTGPKRIIIIGAGQIGYALAQALAPQHNVAFRLRRDHERQRSVRVFEPREHRHRDPTLVRIGIGERLEQRLDRAPTQQGALRGLAAARHRLSW